MSAKEQKIEELDPELAEIKEIMGDEFDSLEEDILKSGEGLEPDASKEGSPGEEKKADPDPGYDPVEGMEPSVEEQKTEGDKQKDKQKEVVDLRALQQARRELREEKQARKAADEAAAADRQKLERRMNELLGALQPDKGKQPSAPDPSKDPLGAIAHDVKTMKQEREEERKAATEAETQQTEFQREMQGHTKSIKDFEAEVAPFAKEDPTLVAAGDYLVHAVKGLLQKRGFEGQQLQVATLRTLSDQARQGLEAEDGPQGYLKRLATFYGWNGQAPQNGDPAVDPSAQTSEKRVTQQDLSAQAERMEKHTSLSGTSGGQAPKSLDAKTIADMSEEQFAAFMERSKRNQNLVESLSGME